MSSSVLFLLNDLGLGGSERKTVRIANALHERGQKVCVAYLNDPDTILDSLNQEIETVFLDRKSKFSIPALLKLRDFVKSRRVSRVFCVNLYPLTYAWCIRFLSRSSRPAIIVLINSTELLTSRERLQMHLYKVLLRNTEKIVFGCQMQMNQWIDLYGLQSINCTYVYNGVNTDYFVGGSDSEESNAKDLFDQPRSSYFLVGTVGKLNTKKRQTDLIRAIYECRLGAQADIKAVIVGEGSQRPELEHLIQELGLQDHVLLYGQVGDVRHILRRIDLFVLTSSTETFSNAALEAMSMGKPVLLSDVGGAREMVRNGQDGYLFEKGRIDQLKGRIEELALFESRRLTMGHSARLRVLENFAFDGMVDVYEDLASE